MGAVEVGGARPGAAKTTAAVLAGPLIRPTADADRGGCRPQRSKSAFRLARVCSMPACTLTCSRCSCSSPTASRRGLSQSPQVSSTFVPPVTGREGVPPCGSGKVVVGWRRRGVTEVLPRELLGRLGHDHAEPALPRTVAGLVRPDEEGADVVPVTLPCPAGGLGTDLTDSRHVGDEFVEHVGRRGDDDAGRGFEAGQVHGGSLHTAGRGGRPGRRPARRHVAVHRRPTRNGLFPPWWGRSRPDRARRCR